MPVGGREKAIQYPEADLEWLDPAAEPRLARSVTTESGGRAGLYRSSVRCREFTADKLGLGQSSSGLKQEEVRDSGRLQSKSRQNQNRQASSQLTCRSRAILSARDG